uniref:RING-type E3 ubiquitin transferase n=3 Tax=Oryza TaxID=4527 RepID=A0A0D3HKR0_9ORYZ
MGPDSLSNLIGGFYPNNSLIAWGAAVAVHQEDLRQIEHQFISMYRQQNQEEHEPLSSAYDGSSPASAIVAVDTNLDTSTPDTYRAPPAPLPYDVSLPVPENPDLEKSDLKSKTDDQQEESLEVDEFKSCEKCVAEDKPDEEDVCPICLEEYDAENPRSLTKCEHHFHLCCILEWMERSDTCPVCDQVS